MKAIVYKDKARLELTEVPVPVCGDEDSILKIEAAAICGADLHWESGAFTADHEFVLGHEFCGTIAEKGSRVGDFWNIGDLVVSDNTGGACGHCSACRRGDFVHCRDRETLGAGFDGGFAAYCKIPGKILRLFPGCLTKVPEGISIAEAAIMEPAANAYRAVVQEAQVRPGDTVVIVGMGPLGLYSLQMARIAGASRIICVGKRADDAVRFPLAKKFGATHLITTEDEDVVERVLEIAGDDGVSAVIDAAGPAIVMQQAMKYLQHDGVFVRIGNPPGKYNDTLLPLIDKQITVIGHMGYNATSWEKVVRLVQSGQLDLKSMVTYVLPLSDYKKGYEHMRRHLAAKVVLIPE